MLWVLRIHDQKYVCLCFHLQVNINIQMLMSLPECESTVAITIILKQIWLKQLFSNSTHWIIIDEGVYHPFTTTNINKKKEMNIFVKIISLWVFW